MSFSLASDFEVVERPKDESHRDTRGSGGAPARRTTIKEGGGLLRCQCKYAFLVQMYPKKNLFL